MPQIVGGEARDRRAPKRFLFVLSLPAHLLPSRGSTASFFSSGRPLVRLSTLLSRLDNHVTTRDDRNVKRLKKDRREEKTNEEKRNANERRGDSLN